MSNAPSKKLFGKPAAPDAHPRPAAAPGTVLAEALPLFQRQDETPDEDDGADAGHLG